MNNVLYQSLPTEWNGYRINTGFHIGVQLVLLFEDKAINDRARIDVMMALLFGDENGEVTECPTTAEELQECINWFLTGWSHDNTKGSEDRIKLMDYDIDQGRIYADFMRFYGIDLETAEMHYWKFCWLLWNLPHEDSSFMQVIEIRTKQPRKGASAEEKEAIKKGHEVYDLEQPKKEYTKEETDAIDKYDLMMAELKNQNLIKE